MTDLIKKIVNCETGEETESKLSKAEIDQLKKDHANFLEETNILLKLKQTKISAYKKLGLTDEEINAII